MNYAFGSILVLVGTCGIIGDSIIKIPDGNHDKIDCEKSLRITADVSKLRGGLGMFLLIYGAFIIANEYNK